MGRSRTGSLWLMAGINWVVFFGAIVFMANLLGQKEAAARGRSDAFAACQYGGRGGLGWRLRRR